VRLGGGLVVLAGMGLMAWNTWKTFATAPSHAPQAVLIPDAAEARA
jgi:cytochrome c oxidase cbb3-type subunit 1